MPRSAIEYFASIGAGDDHLTPNPIKSITQENVDISVRDAWMNAVTEIAVILNGEDLPNDTWSFVTDANNIPINCNLFENSKREVYLIFQRRKHNARFDHICQIKLGMKFDEVPHGFSVIAASLNGTRINNSNNTYDFNIPMISVFIKRSEYAPRKLFFGDPFIVALQIVVGNKEPYPEGFVMIEKSLNNPMFSTKAHLFYRLHRPLGMCDIAFQANALDKYPIQDYDDLPLPVNELHHFIFPHGLRIKLDKRHNYPLPSIFTFVFTDGNGKHLYVAALQFYEVVREEVVEKFFREVYDMNLSGAWGVDMTSDVIFAPKVICVISQLPLYRAMQRYLRQLYSLSLSMAPSRQPLEYFIASVVGEIPLPIPGGRPFYVSLDAGLVGASFAAMPPLRFELPQPDFFPSLDLDFSGPLRVLSVDNLLAVFALLLQEAKLVFLCSSNALLTEVMETLRALLFPMSWSFCFVPRLPDAFTALLEAPGGFMVGLYMAKESIVSTETFHTELTSNLENTSSLQQKHWMQSLQAGTYVVDLSANSIFICEAIRRYPSRALKPVRVRNILDTLPHSPRTRLSQELTLLKEKFGLNPPKVHEDLEKFDFAFEQVNVMSEDPTKSSGAFPTLHVRDVFMAFLAEVLGNYWDYITPPKALTMSGFCLAKSFTSLDEELRIDDYLCQTPDEIKPLVTQLINTQMFAVLLQTRSEELSRPLIFFEKASALMRDAGLMTTAAPRLSGWSSSPKVVTMIPVSLYKLLITKEGMNGQTDFASLRDEDFWDELSVNRNEWLTAVCVSDLDLASSALGPLVLCGPILSALPPLSSLEHQAKNDGGSKGTGGFEWQRLNAKLLALAGDAASSRLASVRTFCAQATAPLVEGVALLPRLKSEYCLMPERQRSMQQSPIGSSFQLECISSYLLMRSLQLIRCSTRTRLDALQVLGFISLMGVTVCRLLEPSVWRALFTAFAFHKEDFFRLVACALFEYLAEAGIPVDSLTAAVYCRHVTSASRSADKKNQVEVNNGLQLHDQKVVNRIPINNSAGAQAFDSFQYLEEVGLSFLTEMTMLPDSDRRQDSPVTTRSNSPSVRSESSYTRSAKKMTSPGEKAYTRYRREMKARCMNAQHSIQRAAAKLGLVRGRNDLCSSAFPVENVYSTANYSTYSNRDHSAASLECSFGLFDEAQVMRRLQASQCQILHPLPDVSNHGTLLTSIANKESSTGTELPQPEFPEGCRRGWIQMGLSELKWSALTRKPPDRSHDKLMLRLWLLSQPDAIRSTTNVPVYSSSDEASSVDHSSIIQMDEFTFFCRDFESDEFICEIAKIHNNSNDAIMSSTSTSTSASLETSVGLVYLSLASIHFSQYDSWFKIFSAASGVSCVGMIRLKISILEAKASDEEVKELCLNEGDVYGSAVSTNSHSGSSQHSGLVDDDLAAARNHTSIVTIRSRSTDDFGSAANESVIANRTYSEGRTGRDSAQPAQQPHVEPTGEGDRSTRRRSNSLTSFMGRVLRGSPIDRDSSKFKPSSRARSKSQTFGFVFSSNFNNESPEFKMDVIKQRLRKIPMQKLSDGRPSDGSKAAVEVVEAKAIPGYFLERGFQYNSPVKMTPAKSHSNGEVSVTSPEDYGSQLAIDISHADPSLISRIRGTLHSNQNKLQTSITEVVGIHSLTPCYCGHLLSDEEVTWSWLNGNRQKRTNMRDRSFSPPMYNDSKLLCQACNAEYFPELHIRCYQLRPSRNIVQPSSGRSIQSHADTGNQLKLAILWQEDVLMLRPAALRIALEKEISASGKNAGDASWLHKVRPELYWNHIWYSLRFGLPPAMSLTSAYELKSGRIQSANVGSLGVVIGWHERFVEAQAEHILRRPRLNGNGSVSHSPVHTSGHSTSGSEPVSIPLTVAGALLSAYLNPLVKWPEAEVASLLTSLRTQLDGSVSGLRLAVRGVCGLIAMNDAPGASNALNDWPLSKRLYHSLAALVQALGSSTCLTILPNNQLVTQSQLVFLDPLYIRMVMAQLSTEDLIEMGGVTKEELILGVPHESVRLLRDTFGFLI